MREYRLRWFDRVVKRNDTETLRVVTKININNCYKEEKMGKNI